jgi:two-component system, chemotaxis family, CheB/CheR fusion protein
VVTRRPAGATGIQPQLLSLYDRLLDRFMPPSFLITSEGQLVDSYAGAERLLKVKGRRPSANLLDMLSDDLRTAVAGLLHRLNRDQEAVRYEGILVPEQNARYSIAAEPIRDGRGMLTHIVISVAPQTQPGPFVERPEATHASAGEMAEAHDRGDWTGLSRDHVQALEDELANTRENLQAAIEEHETTNEELQATNEELIASNEELQSTNEELHSVNEELYTVNAEYQKKNVELQELNDDMEHLLNGTDVATLFLDRQLYIRKFTPRIAGVFQVLPQDLGRPIRTFTHSLTHATLFEDIEQVLQSGVTVETETWDRGGRCYFLRILPYRARKTSRETAQGPPATAPDGVVLTLTDISPLEQVRARVAQLSAIVESSDDAIIGKTLEGVITAWNNGAARLYGYSAEEAIGRHVSFLHPDGRRHEVEAVFKQVREQGPVERLDTVRVRKDGSEIHVSVKFSPIFDRSGSLTGVSAISRDITQLVRARQELAEREERIRLLLDSTAEAIYGVDLAGNCTFCNAACARLLGYDSASSLIGKQMHSLIQHTRADNQPYPPEQSRIYDAMRHREGVHVDDEVLWRRDGTSFPAEYWSHPIVRGGEVIGAVVTFLDITERRRAEQEIQEGVRRREQFLAMLSHELRNPLAAITSATRFLSNTTLDDTCQEAGRVVERQAKHMARLLDDLLDVSRITHGRIVLRNEVVDLRDVARSAVEALQPFMAERETQLSVVLPDAPLPVRGDAARLQQIQANLLSNASKYSPRGAKVQLELTREEDEAVVRVSDEGHGIEAEMLPRIFDLFVQGHRSLARSDGGLGIGLTLLRSLVQLHHGRVEAHSDGVGRGSRFTVWLPLAASDEPSQPVATRPLARTVNTVVLVEDQADARHMLQLLLESHGVTVFTADDGKEGVRLIERLHPELALVDLGLPVLSGFDVARRVRQSAVNAGTRLVALSGYGQESDVKAALEAGFDEHVTKPPDPERLERLLAQVPAD